MYNECIFHVRHHLPGIDICPLHGCWLEIYPLRGDEYPNRNYVHFDYSRIKKQARPCKDEHEIALARCAQEILLNQDDSLCQEEMLEMLYKHLKRRGYVYPNGMIRVKKLHTDLKEFYSEEFLKKKGSLVEYYGNDRRKEWFKWYRPQFKGNIHPHQFLLLVVLLAGDFKTFLSIRDQTEKAEEVEFCCRNPVCPNFNQPVSQEGISTVYCENIVKHIFRCSCGMVYSVRSDNQKPFLLQYGKLWFEEYQKLTSEGLSRAETAERLGVTVNIIKGIRRQKEKFNPVILDDTISKHRAFLLKQLENNPELTRKELNLIPGGCYQFLKIYDRRWLDKTMPSLKGPRKAHSQSSVDYSITDEKYQEKIPEIVMKLKETDPDYRVTKSAILRKLNISPHSLEHLPLTDQIIQESVETTEEFNLRKGYAVINRLIKNQERVTSKRLIKEGVHIYNPKIKKYLLAYMETVYP